MKNLTIIAFLILLIASCSTPEAPKEEPKAEIDLEAELASIETTRAAFQKAVKENDMETLMTVSTRDVKTVGPASAGWLDMYRLGADKGPFPYDSIIMIPTETIIVSDSVAYDMGNSKVYYTNEVGEVVELTNTFLAIIKKGKDGTWKLHREVGSGNVVK